MATFNNCTKKNSAEKIKKPHSKRLQELLTLLVQKNVITQAEANTILDTD